MGHVLARVTGFGWTILPLYPYRLSRVDGDPRALQVAREGSRPAAAIVHLAPGAPRVDLAEGTESANEAFDLLPSKIEGDLRVETSVFTAAWPDGMELVSTEAGAPSPFDFLRSDGCLVYVQGPFDAARLSKIEALCAPGQRIVDQGKHPKGAFIELEYDHDGARHWQRYATVFWGDQTLLVVSAQSLAEQAAFTRAAAAFVLASIEPFER
jgi:hypothetical protein